MLTAALSLRAQVSGDQSADYGLCLLKLGALEHKLIHPKESADYYAQAVRLLPGRPVPPSISRPRRTSTFLSPAPSPCGKRSWPNVKAAGYKSALLIEAEPQSPEAVETRTLYGRFLKEHGRDTEAEALQPPRPSPLPKLDTPKSAATTYRVGGAVTPPGDSQGRSGLLRRGAGREDLRNRAPPNRRWRRRSGEQCQSSKGSGFLVWTTVRSQPSPNGNSIPARRTAPRSTSTLR